MAYGKITALKEAATGKRESSSAKEDRGKQL